MSWLLKWLVWGQYSQRQFSAHKARLPRCNSVQLFGVIRIQDGQLLVSSFSRLPVKHSPAKISRHCPSRLLIIWDVFLWCSGMCLTCTLLTLCLAPECWRRSVSNKTASGHGIRGKGKEFEPWVLSWHRWAVSVLRLQGCWSVSVSVSWTVLKSAHVCRHLLPDPHWPPLFS